MLAASLSLTGCSTLPSAPETTQRQGALVLRDVPPVPDELIERLRQYQNTRSAYLHGWDGKALLVGTRFAETSQVHRLKQAMGAREQITFFDEPILSVHTTPANEDGFLYARDVGGSEFYQLFYFDWASASHRLLTDGSSRYGSVVFSTAGDAFAYNTTERNGRSWDVHVQRLKDGQVNVALEEDEGAYLPLDFSPADDRLLVSRYLSINESRLYEVDLASGDRRPLLEEDLSVAIGMASYDADGTGVYFTSDLGAEFVRLHHLDLATGKIEVLTADVPWNVEQFELSPDGSRLALTINEDGYSRLVVWQLPGNRPLALPELPGGVITGLKFSADSKNIALSLVEPTAPADIWTLSLEARLLARWTRSEVGGLDADGFAAPELVTFPTFDQVDGRPREVPAFVFRPEGEGPHPVLIHIHGGPESQYRPYFSPTFQYLVRELGMVVIAPNVRGSNGYGKSYLKLDNGFRREDSVRDIGALLDWIGTQPDLDSGRVVVRGGSYGGYMVLASLVHYSDRLAAGIESVGISSFVTFLENTQPYRRDLRRAEYGDERDPEMRAHLEAISPLNQVENIRRPLLISQGANDPRVPASESEQIYAAEGGRHTGLVRAGGRRGARLQKESQPGLQQAAVMSLFLERYVLADTSRRQRPEYVIH